MILHLDSIKTLLPWALLILLIGVYMLAKSKAHRPSKHPTQPQLEKTSAQQYSTSSYTAISPLPNFTLATTPPIKLRPFKSIYHMTMSLESITLADLIAMDNTFTSRCQIRKELVQKERHEVLACNATAIPAVLELYDWLTEKYLSARFPSVYTKTGTGLRNNITGDVMPLHTSNAEDALRLMGENIDDEFLILLPSQQEEDEGKYRLEAFINCFPSGFNTRAKLGHLLAHIHRPVPGYAQKLEKSMDRFFANMPVGKVIKRANWSISTNGDLFCLAGNHMAEDDFNSGQEKEEEEEIDLSKTVLRCERQTLHRLPKTRALVFAFKTYQYPIKELRDEGSGEELAEAIEGLGRGSVPGIRIYKREVVWGAKVKAFLRGEIDA